MMKSTLFGLAAALMLSGPAAAMAGDEREITREWPLDGLERIDIEANVGTVTVTGADRDTIALSLLIEPDDDSWGSPGERVMEVIRTAELKERRSGDALVLDLDADRDRDDNDIEEHWELMVPRSIMAIIELNVGEAEITGTRGGVEAEVNVGELTIDVLEGDIDAEVNVGDLRVASETDSPGRFDLEVNIGDVDLEIGGRDVGVERGWLGGRIEHDAGGEDDVIAEVNVGDLGVEID